MQDTSVSAPPAPVAAPGAAADGYRVRLGNFEGPLDLLLHLIQQDEIEIWEISISRITQQYLEYLAQMTALNVEIAGEFLLMAATLMRLKSRGLLPRAAPREEGDEEPQTEGDLIRQLLTYKTFKEAAAGLRRLQETCGPRFPRGCRAELPEDYSYPLQEIDLFTLLSAYGSVLARPVGDGPPVHAVHLDDVRLEEQLTFLLRRLEEEGGRSSFSGLFADPPRRLAVAVTFLAALELARQQVVSLMQDDAFAEIFIVSRVSEDAVLP